MLVQVNKWGNSLAVKIPAEFCKDLQLAKGMEVELMVKNNSLIIAPVVTLDKAHRLAKRVNLKELCARITDENRPDSRDFDFGSVGG